MMSTKPNYAEDRPYWKTGTTAPDTWIEKIKKDIRSIDGKILALAFGEIEGRAAYSISFSIDGAFYRLLWPVLESRGKDQYAAKRQAATALYHDVKARVVAAKWLGTRTAFIPWLVLPSGETVAESSDTMLVDQIPKLFLPRG